MENKIIKIYYYIVASITLIIFSIVLGNFLYKLWIYLFVTDDQYLLKHEYERRYCYEKDIKDINQCREEKKKMLLLKRKVDFKYDLIEFIAYMFPLNFIIIYHFKRLKSAN